MDKIEDSLKGRVALVSGGSRGIGRAMVEHFAAAGVNVCFSFLRGSHAAQSVVEACAPLGGRVLASCSDVGETGSAERFVADAQEHFGRVDFLVCNAGTWEGSPVAEMPEDLWDQTLRVNLTGTWALCRAAVPHMRRRKFGRIVVVSSTAGQRGEANYSNYAAAKGGQISFVKSLALELAGDGINVNAVAPGWVETEMTSAVMSDALTRAEIERAIPLGRVASPEDVARPVLFLCSDWARHVTGEVLNVNGGSVLCG